MYELENKKPVLFKLIKELGIIKSMKIDMPDTSIEDIFD